MKLTLNIAGQDHSLELGDSSAQANRISCVVDGAAFEADVAEIRAGVYSILIGGKSYEVRVSSCPSAEPGSYNINVAGEEIAVAVRDPRTSRRGGRAAL